MSDVDKPDMRSVIQQLEQMQKDKRIKYLSRLRVWIESFRFLDKNRRPRNSFFEEAIFLMFGLKGRPYEDIPLCQSLTTRNKVRGRSLTLNAVNVREVPTIRAILF